LPGFFYIYVYIELVLRCCSRVRHGLDPSMDWIGLGQDFQETLWIGLDRII